MPSALLLLAAAAVVMEPREGLEVVPDEYLVLLRENVTVEGVERVKGRVGGKVVSIGKSFKMVYTKMGREELTWVLEQEEVAAVEYNKVYKIDMPTLEGNVGMGETRRRVGTQCSAVQTTNLSWGQTRCTTNSAQNALDAFSHDPDWGKDVYSYIIDTGVRCTHDEFDGKVCKYGINTAGGPATDETGHGTHVAGIVNGVFYGVAKEAGIISVKVLDASGVGTLAGIVQGLEWVGNDAMDKVAVATIGFAVEYSSTLNSAAAALVGGGVHVVAPAGNFQSDACQYSPASTPDIVTVSSTELGNSGGVLVDARTSFSNTGRCVTLFAPGSAILAAYNTADNAYATLSGSSMAAPHVTGAIAATLAYNPTIAPADMKEKLLDDAEKGVVEYPGTATPNYMLHINCF